MRLLLIVLLWMAFGGIEARAADPPPSTATLEEHSLRQLLTIRRVFVDRMTGGETAAQMRDILISCLEGAKLFILTENQERADVVLRGASEDLIFTDTHTSSDSINAHMTAGSGRSSTKTSGAYGGLGVGDSESDHSTDRRHEAVAAVRLVNKDGDVIWSTTQESLGAKFRGASADVADKITGKLKEDFERARKLR
jgi:hypothetical protein